MKIIFLSCQVITFKATCKSKTVKKTVATFKRGEIDGGDSEEWSGQMVHIPPLPPSDLIYCNIIDIKYYIVVSLIPDMIPVTCRNVLMEH